MTGLRGEEAGISAVSCGQDDLDVCGTTKGEY